eukprot:jgi/Mesvir1/23968/Mv10732-RA.3
MDKISNISLPNVSLSAVRKNLTTRLRRSVQAPAASARVPPSPSGILPETPSGQQAIDLARVGIEKAAGRSSKKDAIIAEMEPEYFTEELDTKERVVRSIPENGWNVTYLAERERASMARLDAIHEGIAEKVMENYTDIVQGLARVTEVERELQVTHVVCRNARRFLSNIRTQVELNLNIAANIRKKQRLISLMEVAASIQNMLTLKSEMQAAVDKSDYAKAVTICLLCLKVIEELREVQCLQYVLSGIERGLAAAISGTDACINDLCSKFSIPTYLKVVDVYVALGDANGLGPKVQQFFAQRVLTDTHDVLRAYAFQAEGPAKLMEERGAGNNKYRIPYNELCQYLGGEWFLPCLFKTYEVLYDLLVSYDAMLNCKDVRPKGGKPVGRAPSMLTGASAKQGGADTAAGKPAGASQEGTERRATEGNGDMRGLAADGGTGGQDGSADSDKDKVKDSKDKDGGSKGAAPGAEGEEEEHWAAVDKMVEGVRETLKKERKMIWELAARRVAILLSASALGPASGDNFLQVLDFSNQFIMIGESFSQLEAPGLWAKLSRQSRVYFESFHKHNMEVLKMTLERERWDRLPPSALAAYRSSLDMRALQQRISEAHITNRLTQRTPFAQWVAHGNPFRERGPEGEEADGAHDATSGAGAPKEEHKVEGGAAGAHEGAMGGKLAAGLTKPSGLKIQTHTAKASTEEEDDDEESENAELKADYIEEEGGQSRMLTMNSSAATPGAPAAAPTAQKGAATPKPSANGKDDSSKGDAGRALTASSLTVIRFIDKYLQLMQKLQPISVDIFKGICQLFESYLLSVFNTFGRPAELANETPTNNLLTPRLQTTLRRILAELQELGTIRKDGVGEGGTGAAGGAPASGVEGTLGTLRSAVSGAATPSPGTTNKYFNSGNLYGLKERCVAADSLVCLADQLRRNHGRLQSGLPHAAAPQLDHFFNRTVDAVGDLVETIYKSVTHLLLQLSWLPDKVANSKWELKELDMNHNAYVNNLVAEFRAFAAKLKAAGVSSEVQSMLWRYAVSLCCEDLVEGLSRIKRCTNEGRALMALDLQVFINDLQGMMPHGEKPNMHVVDNYIKVRAASSRAAAV